MTLVIYPLVRKIHDSEWILFLVLFVFLFLFQFSVFRSGRPKIIEETSLCAYIRCITILSSIRLKTGLLNFGVRLQETRHNMAEYFGLFSAVIMPSLGSYGQ